MARKQSVSYHLSPDAVKIIQDLAKKLGLSQAAIIEMAVRKLDNQERMNDPHPDLPRSAT